MTNMEAIELGGGHGHDDAHTWLRELDDADVVAKAIRESLASAEAPSDELINALLLAELTALMGFQPKHDGSLSVPRPWTSEALSWFEGYDKAWRVVLETRLAELTS